MAQDTIIGTDTVKDALLTKVNNDIAELFAKDAAQDAIYNPTTQEVQEARGSRSSLDDRLSEALNDDGTLKSSAPTSGFWTTETATISYVSSTQFTVEGDKTSIYAVRRALKLTQTNDAYGYVKSSSYSSPNTTVTVTGCTVDSGLSKVEYGQIVESSPYPGIQYDPSTGYVRIGEGTPQNQFEVLDSSSNDLITLTDSGYLGVGESSPGVRLHVKGNVKHVEEFTAGESITSGDWVTIGEDGKAYKYYIEPSDDNDSSFVENVSSVYIDLALLDSTHIVAVYARDSDSYGRAVVGEISGNSVSWGTPVTFNAATTSYPRVTVLSSSSFVVSYVDDGNGYYPTLVACTVSGTTITAGSETVIESTSSQYRRTDITTIDSTHFLCAYGDYTNTNVKAVVGQVSGTSITLGSTAAVDTATSACYLAEALDSTHVIICYSGGTKCGLVDTGALSISFPSAELSQTIETGLCVLDSTHFIGLYAYASGINAYLVSVSGTTLTLEDSLGILSGFSVLSLVTNLSTIKISDKRVLYIAYDDDNNKNFWGEVTISDDSSSIDLHNYRYITDFLQVGILKISDSLMITMKGAGSYGYYGDYQIMPFQQVLSDFKGHAITTASSGNSVQVQYDGVVNGLSGLYPGREYIVDRAGTLELKTMDNTDSTVGKAISTTELLLGG